MYMMMTEIRKIKIKLIFLLLSNLTYLHLNGQDTLTYSFNKEIYDKQFEVCGIVKPISKISLEELLKKDSLFRLIYESKGIRDCMFFGCLCNKEFNLTTYNNIDFIDVLDVNRNIQYGYVYFEKHLCKYITDVPYDEGLYTKFVKQRLKKKSTFLDFLEKQISNSKNEVILYTKCTKINNSWTYKVTLYKT
jgi:hypothetical protein